VQLVVPLFLDCSRSLSENEQFQSILTTLLTSDRTYIKMARELVSSETAGPVLELIENMIQSQLIDYSKYGLSTPTALINLWLDCLTHNTNWHKDWSTIHLIDIIVRFSYQFPDAWASTKGFFKQFYKVSVLTEHQYLLTLFKKRYDHHILIVLRNPTT
jgi:hypothetical protein